MKVLLFDAGPIISLTMNNLLWILEPLKKSFGGSFCLVDSVKKELVDRPLRTKKFKFEALQVQVLIDEGVLDVIKKSSIKKRAQNLLDCANTVFSAHKNPIRLVDFGEMECIAAALEFESNNVVVDERITRSLIENPLLLRDLMSRRLHTKVCVDKKRLREFLESVRHLRLIRSAELVTIAYEQGLLDKYVVSVPKAKKQLLQSVLWGVKLNGCAVTQEEIDELVKLELEKR